MQLGVVLVQADEDVAGAAPRDAEDAGLDAVERRRVAVVAGLRVDDVQVPVLVAAASPGGRSGGGRPRPRCTSGSPRSVSDVTGRARVAGEVADPHVQDVVDGLDVGQAAAVRSDLGRSAVRVPEEDLARDQLGHGGNVIRRAVRPVARTLPRMDSRPIGMFDSGVGGLTVLHECLVTLPHEDFVYFGDSHPDRFPYGPKPADVIAPVRPRGGRAPGRARREADRGRLQRGDGVGAARASSASSRCR